MTRALFRLIAVPVIASSLAFSSHDPMAQLPVAEPVTQIQSYLAAPGSAPMFQLRGTGGGHGDVFKAIITLRIVPCPGRYEFVSKIEDLVDGGSTMYRSIVRLIDMKIRSTGKARGTHISCGRSLAREIGARSLRLDFEGLSDTNVDRHLEP